MANHLIETVIFTIEEVCFIAHMLIQNVSRENQLIIDTYKSLSEDVVYKKKEVCLAFFQTLKNEKASESENDEETTAISTKSYVASEGIIDYHLSDYFNYKRSQYVLEKERKDYLIRTILGI